LSGSWESVSTAVGEYRVVKLSDGTRVQLNTQTRARWRFTGRERSVRLLEGEALFDVGKDPRPFRVRLGDTLIEDVGTAFSVRLRDDKSVDVVVADGIVRVGSGQPGKDEGSFAAHSMVSEFRAGQVATVSAGGIVTYTLSEEEIVGRLAWTTGQLWFRGERLDSIVAEFNRYNSRRLVIDSPCVAEYRIGGRYDTTDPDGFARAIQSIDGAEVRTLESGVTGESIHLHGNCDGADVRTRAAR
jgi:transmembrane sensor